MISVFDYKTPPEGSRLYLVCEPTDRYNMGFFMDWEWSYVYDHRLYCPGLGQGTVYTVVNDVASMRCRMKA